MPVNVEIPVEKWSGSIRAITLGATVAEGGTRGRTVTVGGQTTLPFLGFDGKIPNRPVVAVEVWCRNPGEEWAEPLIKAWGAALVDPATWAKAADAAGADVIALRFTTVDASGARMTGAKAKQIVRSVLGATGLPLIVLGAGQADLDNELLIAVAEEGVGERLVSAPARIKTTARSSRPRWQTVIWSPPRRRWTSICPSN